MLIFLEWNFVSLSWSEQLAGEGTSKWQSTLPTCFRTCKKLSISRLVLDCHNIRVWVFFLSQWQICLTLLSHVMPLHDTSSQSIFKSLNILHLQTPLCMIYIPLQNTVSWYRALPWSFHPERGCFSISPHQLWYMALVKYLQAWLCNAGCSQRKGCSETS